MIRIIFYFFLFIITFPSPGQDVVYVTTLEREATWDVIIVDNPIVADICVNVVQYQHQLPFFKNSWHFTKQRSKATIIIRLAPTTNGNRNAIRMYLHQPPVKYLSHKWIEAYRHSFH